MGSLSDSIREAAAARREDSVKLLQALVQFRSENPKLLNDPAEQENGRLQEGACQEFIASTLGDLGLKIDRWEPLPGRENVVGVLHGTGKGRSLILNGHVDVVPAGDPADWPCDPWLGTITDGCIWGRGACDMKGGLVSGITALSVLHDLGLRLEGDVIFQAVVDEETGGPGTRSTVERGYRADGALVLEPTAGSVMPVEGGLEWLRLTVRGHGGHSAVRYRSVHAGGRGEAVSAIEKATKLLGSIQELERDWGNRKVHPLMPNGITTINPGVIVGGSGGGAAGMANNLNAYSNFADYCSLGLSLKYLPDEDGGAVRREFEQYISRVCQADPWLAEHPPEIEWGVSGVSFPPAETSVDHPFVRSFARAHATALGKPRYVGFEAVTDLAWLAQAGIPGLIFGPGDARYAHGSHEHVPIDDVVSCAEVIALAAAEWCGPA